MSTLQFLKLEVRPAGMEIGPCCRALARFHKTICHFSAVFCSPYILFSSCLFFHLFLIVLEYTCACNFLRGSVNKEQRFDVRDQCQADPPVLDFHESKNHLAAGNEQQGAKCPHADLDLQGTRHAQQSVWTHRPCRPWSCLH